MNLLIYYKFAKWQVKIEIQNDVSPVQGQTSA